VERRLDALRELALQASDDHDTWLATAEVQHVDDPYSLAAALACYDRDDLTSARGLEIALALMILPMGQPALGTEEQDRRFQRLERWLDQHESPLYTALAPFNPFKDKADAVGSLLGASDNVIEGLFGRFPAMANITDLTAQTVHTVSLKRLRGKTRWDASRSLHQQVQAAARAGNLEKVLGLLAARYGVTEQSIRESAFSQETEKYLKNGMACVDEMKELRISGSRNVRIELTTTARIKPTPIGVLMSNGGGVLNAGMLLFNLISLQTAYDSLLESDAPEYELGFAASIFGVLSAASTALLSARSAQITLMLRFSPTVPGIAFGTAITKFLGSNLFNRVSGYAGIYLGFLSDKSKSERQEHNGDSNAANFTYYGGVALALGSALMLEGGLGFAGLKSLLRVDARTALIITIVGGAIVLGGLYLHSKAHERLHNPIELWAARSMFGNLRNDGEIRPGIVLDHERKLPRFITVQTEIEAWHIESCRPRVLSKDQASLLGLNLNLQSPFQNAHFTPPDWAFVPNDEDALEQARDVLVFLPGFAMGISEWTISLKSSLTGPIFEKNSLSPNTLLVETGLVLRFKKPSMHQRKTTLTLLYSTNYSPLEEMKINLDLNVEH
jgi:hypothetical protein